MTIEALSLTGFIVFLSAAFASLTHFAVRSVSLRLQRFGKLDETLLHATSLEEAAPVFLGTLGAFARIDAAYVFLNSKADDAWRCEAYWTTKDASEPYCLATKELVCRAGVDLPGRVLELKERLEVTNFASEANYPRAVNAIASGIKRVLAIPLIVNDELLGCIEFCSYRHRGVDVKLIEAASQSFARFLTRDIAQRRAHEQESHLKVVIDSAPDGIVIINNTGVIQTVNKAASKLLGYSTSELMNQSVLLFLPDVYRSRYGSATTFYFDATVQGLIGHTAEVIGQRKDGTKFPLEVAISRMETGERHIYIGIMRDISDRKLMERRVSEFYSTISHELRSPLASIRGSLGLIEGGAMGALPDEVIELTAIARRNCDRLMRLINDILDAKKMEAGKLEMRIEPVRPEALIFAAVEGMQSFAAESKISLVAYATDSPAVLADSDRAVQVLTNLLSNAVKYSTAGGQVDIFLEEAISGPDYVRFCVQDRGPGIDSEQLFKLFSEFQQVDASDSRAKGGTGLGLAISKSIVEQLSGLIGVDNHPGRGATFWFELPALSDAPDADPTLSAQTINELANSGAEL